MPDPLAHQDHQNRLAHSIGDNIPDAGALAETVPGYQEINARRMAAIRILRRQLKPEEAFRCAEGHPHDHVPVKPTPAVSFNDGTRTPEELLALGAAAIEAQRAEASINGS